MSASLTITPASGSITAKRTICRVDVAGADANDVDAFDPAVYPTAPEVRYYIKFVTGSKEYGRSYVFAPNGGTHQFNNYIFPSAGTWTVTLNKVSDDSVAATLSVVVA